MTKWNPEDIERKIYTTLSVYPRLMASHLQISLGTSMAPKLWRPVLREMIDRGIIIEREVQVNEHIYPETEFRTTFHKVLCLAKSDGVLEKKVEVTYDQDMAAVA